MNHRSPPSSRQHPKSIMTRRALKSRSAPAGPSATNGDSPGLRAIVDQLQLEVQNLLRHRWPAPPSLIEELCAALHAVSGGGTFTAKGCLENCQRDNKSSDRLAMAITHVIHAPIPRVPDTEPSLRLVVNLSRALTRACGVFGPWMLLRHRERSNAGSVFMVVYIT